MSVCLGCGEFFKRKPSELRRGGGKYCSNKCRAKHINPLGDYIQVKKDSKVFLEVLGKNTPIIEEDESMFLPPPNEIDPKLLKIRQTINKLGKCVAYDRYNAPIGEYDWDGKLTEY